MTPRPGLLAAALALLLLAAGAAPARAADEDGRFDDFARTFLREWLARRPELATALGEHAHDERLEPDTPGRAADERAWLAARAAEVAGFDRLRLSADRRADRDLLARRIAAERFALDTLALIGHDPGVVLAKVEIAMKPLLECEAVPICNRVRAAAARLARVPEVVRTARISLVAPDRRRTESAIARGESLLAWLRLGVPALMRECREPLLQADLAEADSAAVGAIADYLVALREDAAHTATDVAALGGEGFARWLALAEEETTPPERLLEQAKQDLAAARAALGRAPSTEARADTVPAGDAARFARAEGESLAARARARGAFPFEERPDWIVRPLDGPAGPAGFAELRAPGPWDSRDRKPVLAIATRPWPRADAVRDVARESGRLIYERALRRQTSALRVAFAAPSAAAGWAAYVEEVAIENHLATATRTPTMDAGRREVLRHARAVAAFELHDRGEAIADVARRLGEAANLAPDEALRETIALAGDPGAVCETLGLARLMALRAECERALGTAFDLGRFHAAVLEAGPLPMPAARPLILEALGIPPPGR